jgi:hypothetical protein
MRFVVGVVSVVLAVVSTGCATLTGPKYERIQVTSNPPGAEVRLYGAPVGRTPVPVELDLTRPAQIEVEAQGYAPQQCRVRLQPGVGYVVADVVLCVLLFPLGCISFIDAMGAWNEADVRACNVNLAPGAGGAFGQPPAAYPPTEGYPPPPSTGSYPPPPPPAPGGGTAYPPPPPPM